jgi:pyruvate formate lyase activating enzyme
MQNVPPTPVEALNRAREIGLAKGLRYVYVGNVREEAEQDTVCPACGKNLIERRGFVVLANSIRNGCCPDCGAPIAGVGRRG